VDRNCDSTSVSVLFSIRPLAFCFPGSAITRIWCEYLGFMCMYAFVWACKCIRVYMSGHSYMYSYIHIYIHAYTHTPTEVKQPCLIRVYMSATSVGREKLIHACIHTYIHACIHTCIVLRIHTHINSQIPGSLYAGHLRSFRNACLSCMHCFQNTYTRKFTNTWFILSWTTEIVSQCVSIMHILLSKYIHT
jgi:hypothetical protein